MDDLERWRDEFPILSRWVYMIDRVMAEVASITAARDYAAGDGSSLVT
jgi:hypothetical protein